MRLRIQDCLFDHSVLDLAIPMRWFNVDFLNFWSKTCLCQHQYCKSSPLNVRADVSSPGDLERLLFSAIGVVLRRDMSLNRRLFIWLLGPESQPTYFLKYAQGPVTEALKKLLKQQGNLLPNPIRVSKISLALLDKWE